MTFRVMFSFELFIKSERIAFGDSIMVIQARTREEAVKIGYDFFKLAGIYAKLEHVWPNE